VIVLHGWYHWFPRRGAFRADYCRRCEAATTSVRVRTLDVAHLFWVPLLPVGFWSRWFCLRCGARPHAAARTRRGWKVAGAVLLLLGSFAGWTMPIERPDDVAVVWLLRIAVPLAFAATLVSIVRHRPEPAFAERLAAVRPWSHPDCPLCGGALERTAPPRCSRCGARHLPLGGRGA
jgi:hypothetical protein